MHAVYGGHGIQDIRLVNVWLDFHELATALNLAHQTQRKLLPDIFQEALISIQYRLQHLAYDARERHEVLRLALLALSTTIFHDTDGVKFILHYRPLAERYKTALLSLVQHSNEELPAFILWLAYVGRISVLNPPAHYHWLKDCVIKQTLALNLRSWAETRHVLKTFIWIDMVNDQAGERVFDVEHTSSNTRTMNWSTSRPSTRS